MTSALFHAIGKVDVIREQLIISVNKTGIKGNESFSDLALTFSCPGYLFRGNDKLTLFTSSQDTDLKLKRSSFEKGDKEGRSLQLMRFAVTSLDAVSAVFLPTDEKNRSN